MKFVQTLIPFRIGDEQPVVDAMVDLTARGDGQGWINIEPVVDEGLAAAVDRSWLAAWVSGRGPALPMVTWTPPRTEGKPTPGQLGISHPAGPDSLKRLSEAGLGMPDRWIRRQDHAKRGIVLDLPADTDAHEMLRWSLGAADELSKVVLNGDWQAHVNRPPG